MHTPKHRALYIIRVLNIPRGSNLCIYLLYTTRARKSRRVKSTLLSLSLFFFPIFVFTSHRIFKRFKIDGGRITERVSSRIDK